MYICLSHRYLEQRSLMGLIQGPGIPLRAFVLVILFKCRSQLANAFEQKLNSLSLDISCQQSNLRVDGCLHYGGAMSGSISYPRVDGVAGYGTTLGIVNYISDKVFQLKKTEDARIQRLVQPTVKKCGIFRTILDYIY